MASSNNVRIIGGRFRGRRLRFPAVKGLRPTPDRLRETLFNWLQGELAGAHCLDLFAGSGALGLEAFSRGAAFVRFVEASGPVVRQLKQNLALLGLSGQSEVVKADALRILTNEPEQPFDIAFLDPPYALNLLPALCERLEAHGWLVPGAWIYLEQESHRPWFELPAGWEVHREARAGQAACRLVRRGTMPDSTATDDAQ